MSAAKNEQETNRRNINHAIMIFCATTFYSCNLGNYEIKRRVRREAVIRADICIFPTSSLHSRKLFLLAFELIYEIYYLLFRLYLLSINRTELHLSFLCCAKNVYGLQNCNANAKGYRKDLEVGRRLKEIFKSN